MQPQLNEYIHSSCYQHDVNAIRVLWKNPGVVGIAGMFMFLSYLTIPILTDIRPSSAIMKIGLSGEREKHFLLRMLGLSDERDWKGGIRNSRVRAMILHLRRSHLQFVGMQPAYIYYFAGIIALSILRVQTCNNVLIDNRVRMGYWRYMRYACSLLGVPLSDEVSTHQRCELFIDKHTQSDEQGKILFKALCESYPSYIEQSLPVLFPRTLLVIQSLWEDIYA